MKTALATKALIDLQRAAARVFDHGCENAPEGVHAALVNAVQCQAAEVYLTIRLDPFTVLGSFKNCATGETTTLFSVIVDEAGPTIN